MPGTHDGFRKTGYRGISRDLVQGINQASLAKFDEVIYMAKLKIYGMSGSRALRSLWAIEETGEAYEHFPVTYGKDSKEAEYLAVNPNGKVPALIDGELSIFESMAINLYLAKHYAKDLYSTDPSTEAQIIQWSFWGISEIEPLQMPIVLHKFLLPEEKRNEKIIASSSKQLQTPLRVLDEHLANKRWLVGDNFTIADLNLSAVMLLLSMVEFDYSNFSNATRWANACYARPALERAKALK